MAVLWVWVQPISINPWKRREIRRGEEELGSKATRILPWLLSLPPTDRRFHPVYVACCAMCVPLCTQIGHTRPLMPSEVGSPIYVD